MTREYASTERFYYPDTDVVPPPEPPPLGARPDGTPREPWRLCGVTSIENALIWAWERDVE
jgi:hypothetical protein